MANGVCPKCSSNLFDGEYCRMCNFFKRIIFKWRKNRRISEEVETKK